MRGELEEKTGNLKIMEEQLQLADQKITEQANEVVSLKKENEKIMSEGQELKNQLEIEREKTNHLLSEYNSLVDSYK